MEMIEIQEGNKTVKRFTANAFSIHITGKSLLDSEMLPRLVTRYNNAMQEKRSEYRAIISKLDQVPNDLINHSVKYIIIKK